MRVSAVCLLLLAVFAPPLCTAQRALSVQGGELRLNGVKVFLSGMDIAWYEFGNDFGNGQYSCCTGPALEGFLQSISNSSGNSIRMWLHCDGSSTPSFDASGYVTGTDGNDTMITDLTKFLVTAKTYNIIVFLVLWNGAVLPTTDMENLIWDDSKLQSYIDNALVPMVSALKDHNSLGGWEIINEPEGLVYSDLANATACYDTTPLAESGAGWTNAFVPMYRLQRFINKQISAIKTVAPNALATVGSWSEKAQTDHFGYRNYYKDSCLLAAGGEPLGTIDIQEMHTYSSNGQYNPTSPMVRRESVYGLSKPTIIGEFSQSGGDGRDITALFNWAYTQGYSGSWSWQANGSGGNSDDFNTQARGTDSLAGRNDTAEGGQVDIKLQ